MTDKKLTYKEIIKALECCAKSKTNGDCKALKCPCFKDVTCIFVDDDYGLQNLALDLITRQQAELENLKVENQSLRTAGNSLKMHYEEAQAEVERLESANDEKFRQWDMLAEKAKQHYADLYNEAKDILKAEAYKEFAEKLKEKASKMEMACCGAIIRRDYTINEETLDNLVKEMVGDDNA